MFANEMPNMQKSVGSLNFGVEYAMVDTSWDVGFQKMEGIKVFVVSVLKCKNIKLLNYNNLGIMSKNNFFYK